MGNVFLCATCDARGPLRRLKPSDWYVCMACFRHHDQNIPKTLLAVVERLKKLCLTNDPRMNDPRVLEQIETLSKDLQASFQEAREEQAKQELELLERTALL